MQSSLAHSLALSSALIVSAIPLTTGSATLDTFPAEEAVFSPTAFIVSPSAQASPAPQASSQSAPTSAAIPQGEAVQAETVLPNTPTRIRIPAVGLNDAVVGVGLTSNGEMAVPSGKSSNVGWYKYGTVPGQYGSAVFDAHVFAAFSKLASVKIGGDIYVTVGSKTLHFVVDRVATYALNDISGDDLFNRSGGRYLNLITCAGTYVPSRGTYDKRLIVYAELAS